MNRWIWFLAAAPLALLGLVIVLIAAWVPVAHEAAEADAPDPAMMSTGLDGDQVPAEYHEVLTEWGQYCPTLTPARLAAQIQVESGWDPRAHNTGSGAQGMAQFLPGTWQEYGTDGNGDGRADVWDPFDAIASAAVYDCAVADMVADVPGDPVDLMLAAYNAGPGAVLNASGVPPYEETINYIDRIGQLEGQLAGSGGELGGERATGEAGDILTAARGQLGTPYVWGGGDTNGPTHGGFDCSGLTQYAVYQGTGGRVSLPRTSQAQREAGDPVERGNIRPGDLIVINHDGAWGHVGIYSGDGRMIHAPRTGRDVEEVDVFSGYWADFGMDIRRVT